MAWSPEISQLSTDVTQLTDAVNVKKNQLSGAVTSAQSSRITANTNAIVAESGAVLSAASMQTANTHKNSTLSVYGTQVAQQASVGTATSHAANAATSLATLAATLTQDLSGVTAQALHRSPNAVTSMFVYDTSKDSDGGAWTEKCQHTSWYNESISGKWLGPRLSELEARYEGATLSVTNLVTNGTFASGTTGWENITATLSVVDGEGVINGSASGYVRQSITTVAGKTYQVTCSARKGTTSTASISFGGVYASTTSSTTTPLSCLYTATGTSTLLWLQVSSAGTAYYDNISVREVTALNTTSGDYFQLTTDGKFYRLWKNLLTSSSIFNTTLGWAVSGGSLGGTNNTFIENTTDSQHYMQTSAAQLVGTRGRRITATFEIKPVGNRTWIRASVGGGGNSVWFNLTGAGSVGTVPIGSTGVVTQIDDGFYRITVSTLMDTLEGVYLFTATNNNISSHVGDGVSGFTLRFGQIEDGLIWTGNEAKTGTSNVLNVVTEVFRGNKRDFPRLASLVAEANSITIYDLTEPGRPMWMRFNVSAGNNLLLPDVTSLAAISGIIGLGTKAEYGFQTINFMADDSLRASAGQRSKYMGNISQRNSVIGHSANGIGSIPFIANNIVNAVAMTILPDAPIDPVTGLRVPTIAVATGAGVSIIRHDGIVRNSSFTNSVFFIYIDKSIVMFSRTGSRGVYFAINPGSLGASWNPSIMGGDPDQYQNNNPVLERFFSRSSIARFDTISVSRKMNNEVTPARGLNSLIQSRFNTGWMPGDIRRAYLSDTEVGSITGPELVVNGNFSSGVLSPWSEAHNGAGASVTVTDGRVNLIKGTSGGPGISQNLGMVVGKTYVLRLNIYNITGNLYVEAGGPGTNIGSGTGEITRLISAAGPTLRLVTLGEGSFDNISLREFVADRSYKSAAAIINGILTRSQLASGTSLVGYSGFSAANYLREPYSSDLDFGTGEFSASAWVNIPAALPTTSFPFIGANLVTNGDFSSGTTTGWTTQFASIVVVAERLKLIPSDANTRVAYQSFSTAIGKTYELSVDYDSGTASSVNFYAGTINGGGDLIATATRTGSGTYKGFFRATTTTTFIHVGPSASNSGKEAFFDNISVREVSPVSIFSREHSSGAKINLGVNSLGNITAEAFDGTTTRTATTTTAYNNAQWLKAEANYTTDGSLAIRVNGREVAVTRGTPLLSLNSRRNLLTWSEGFVSPWVLTSTSLSGTSISGFSSSVQFGNNSAFRGLTTPIFQTSGVAYVVSAFVEMDDGLAPVVGATSNLGDFSLVTADSFATSPVVTRIGTTNVYRVSAIHICTVNGARQTGVYKYTTQSVRTLKVTGLQLELGSVATEYQRVNSAADFADMASLTIGNSYTVNAPFPGSIALLKLGATAPTPEQSVFMYEQEKQLFRPGAISILPDANAIIDMSYDDATDRWAAISTTNESYWNGLVRSSVTPVPAGSYSKITTTSGVELVSRTTTNPGVDVSIPPYALREELVKKSEAASRLSRKTVTYDFTGGFTGNITTGSTSILSVAGLVYPTSYIGARISGTGIPANTTITGVSGTTIYISAPATATTSTLAITFLDFNLPAGMEAKVVLTAGVIKREGSTSDYTRLFDGFIETIRFAVAPGSTAWVQIQATRTTQ